MSILAGMRSVRVRYHPVHPKNRVAFEFLTRAKGRRAAEVNPGCKIEVEVIHPTQKVVPPRIEIQFENDEILDIDAGFKNMRDISEEIRDAQEHLEFQQLRDEYNEEQDDEEDGDGYLLAWDPAEKLEDPVGLEDIRKDFLENRTKQPIKAARVEHELQKAEYYSLQRRVRRLEARAALDPDLATKLANVKKELAVQDAKYADIEAKIKASEPISKMAHKAVAKKPAAEAKPASKPPAKGK